jgi:Peptidase M15
MPLDYASIMKAGQGLVPDLQEQMYMAEQNRAMRDHRQSQTALNQFAFQQKQQAATREQQFHAEMADAVESGNPRAVSALMVKYPEFADKIKPGWDAYSKEGRQRALTGYGSVYVRAQNGDYSGAADRLQAMHDADVAAGQGDEDTPQIIAALRSNDPTQQKVALGTLGIVISAADPEKFGETYGKLNPTDVKSSFAKEYDDRVARFGKPAADLWAETENITVGPQGGVVVDKRDYVPGAALPAPTQAPQPKGGDPVRLDGGGIEARAKQVVPGVVVTSRQRSPAHNAKVGGKPNSYHLTGQARDFTPPAGMSMSALRANLASALPGYDVINEGDHVHVEPGPGTARSKSAVEETKVINGKKYFRIGGKWFDNPRGA